MEKVDYKNGDVRQILSGNGIILAGPVDPETGLPRIKYVTLSGINAPDFSLGDKEQPRQQPYGFKAREYLRKLILGKKVEFAVEMKIKDSNEKVIGHIKYNGEDISIQLLKLGLVQLRDGSKSLNNSLYQEAQTYAQSKKIGLWDESKKNKEIQEYVVLKPLDISQNMISQQFQDGIIEDVQGLFAFYVYVKELKGLLKCCFGDIFTTTQNQVFSKKVKWALDGLISQQNGDIVILGYDEKLQAVRVDLFVSKQDIKKQLLSQGHYKLAPNAYQLIGSQQRYNELRECQNQAELQSLGLWKDSLKVRAQNQINQSEKQSFQARIIEIHSGDCLSVFNESSREVQRLCLASVRAPAFTLKDQKPWGFESKEFLRKNIIGKQAQVEIEYEKKIPPKLGEDDERKPVDLLLTFGNVILMDKEEKIPNIGVMIVQAGLAQVIPPRGDDGFSRYIEELKVAQESAIAGKKGINAKEQAKLPKFNDLSIKGQGGKAKDNFSFLKSEKKLLGVVDLVLSGSRFKVRFNQNNSYNLFVLAGIRCLPNDQNFPDFQKFSNLALQYAKQNILQRDVEIDLEAVDKRGIYHGHLIVNRQNFSLKLLELGFAITYNPFGSNKFEDLFLRAEKEAQLRKEGLWKIQNLNLSVVRGDDEEDQNETNIKPLNGKVTQLIATEIIDGSEIYLQDQNSQILKKIESTLDKFDATDVNKLVSPLKKGLQCIAQFSADDRWYRAKIIREIVQKGKDTRYEVFFVDYGNFDILPITRIRKMLDQLAQLPFQAIRTALAYCKTHNIDQPLGVQIGEFVRSQIWEKDLLVEMNYTDGAKNYVTIYLTQDKSPEKTLNLLLLAKGYAKLNESEVQCPHKSWKQASEDAENDSKGIWIIDQDEQL